MSHTRTNPWKMVMNCSPEDRRAMNAALRLAPRECVYCPTPAEFIFEQVMDPHQVRLVEVSVHRLANYGKDGTYLVALCGTCIEVEYR